MHQTVITSLLNNKYFYSGKWGEEPTRKFAQPISQTWAKIFLKCAKIPDQFQKF